MVPVGIVVNEHVIVPRLAILPVARTVLPADYRSDCFVHLHQLSQLLLELEVLLKLTELESAFVNLLILQFVLPGLLSELVLDLGDDFLIDLLTYTARSLGRWPLFALRIS